MFEQYRFIQDDHKPMLESVIRQHAVVTSKLMVTLYETTVESLEKSGSCEPRTNVTWSYIGDGKGNKVASATDFVTGIYVQLVETAGSKARHLTVGAKWCAQARMSETAVATKMW